MKSFLQCSTAAMFMAAFFPASAQVQPDAGTLQQQVDRERQQALPKRIAPEKPAEPPPLKAGDGLTVTVREFRFAGNSLIPAEALTPVVGPFLNRPLDFSQLQAVTAAVANAYRQAGWIVRAYLPQQDIADGVVTLQIVEAVFGSILIEGAEPSRLKLTTVLGIFEGQQRKGEPLNAGALDRALLLADDLPGITVAGTLQSGTNQGETDLVLKLADEPLLIGEATLDNTGARSTGSSRLSVALAVGSPLGLADQLALSGIHTQGSDYIRAAYSLPVGSDGWRIGVNTSHLAYRLIAPEFAGLNAHGTSDTGGLEASYPLVRSRLQNLYLNLNVDRKKFDNQSSNAVTSHYAIDAFTIALNGNLFDNWGGGGANAANLTYVAGDVDLTGSPNQAADARTTNTQGHYAKWRWMLSRQQVVTDEVSLLGQITGQRAGKNLDSSEKLFLGGAAGVRAYPSNEAGGSEGQMANLELRWKLPDGLIFTGFLDWGRVTVNRNNNYVGSANPNIISLRGHGLSIAWLTPLGVNLKAVWAQRDGSNPNPTSTGNDQDGTLIRNRFWLNAVVPF